VRADELTAVLDQRTQATKETTIFFQADTTVDYETLMCVRDTLRKAGYLKVGLVGMEGAAK
ncbi:MAG: biopolymer transporter ExbD, partial [Serratia inhibens]|uniref:biopolymer transporter ExbD n=1 Tax=Serratia inhibens TaxID=2338073 RepID=UPI003C7C29A3